MDAINPRAAMDRTPEEEARWIAADAEADRLKREDPYRERDQYKLIQEQNDWLRATGGML